MKKEKAKKEKKPGFFAEFKAFITKGNVLDLAVAVIIGGAFGKIVSSLVSDIILPLISPITGNINLSELKYEMIKPEFAADGVTVAKEGVYVMWGAWLQTIIDFLIIALCIFVIVRIVKNAERKLNAKKLAAEAEAAAKAKAEADAKAAEEAAKEEARKAREDEFYANVKEQTELLRKLAQK